MSAGDCEARKTGWLHRFLPLRAVRDEARWRYRDRVCLSVAWAEGRWRFGMKCRDRLIPIPYPPLQQSIHTG